METMFLCFLIFGVTMGYVGARLAHINSSQFKTKGELTGECSVGMFIGFGFTLVISLYYLTEIVPNDPDRVAYQALKPVVFHDKVKQCEFFIENKRSQYIVLEDK